MEITNKSRLNLRIQGLIFLVLFLAMVVMLAWLSKRYSVEADWTATGRNTLSEASIKLVQRLPERMTFTAFARDSDLVPTRKSIRDLVGRYQKHSDLIELIFIDPVTKPDVTRKMGISVEGEIVMEYQGRSEHIKQASEENITNALQRLLRSGERRLLFISGHGERNPLGQANHDLGQFSQHLAKKGVKVETLALTETPAIPADVAALVIASPQVNYLDGEVKMIRDYVLQGGNLLWLHEPGGKYNLDALGEALGIDFYPGVVVDPSTQLLGISDPTFSLVVEYPNHPITSGFELLTLFPQAVGINHEAVSEEWNKTALLQTVSRSWSEAGELKGAIQFDPGVDTTGPLTIGLALSREVERATTTPDNERGAQQRIVILGDGDFISNAYLGNQGNQDMGHAIINWLSNDDFFIDIPSATAPDSQMNLDQTTWSVIGLVFLVGLPLGLVASGVTVWMKRRKR
ncbi:MAG: GldG family protein [Gammaproteobacteria bacterium]